MKKLLRLGLVLGVLTAALACTALAAEGAVYGTGSVSYDSASGKCSVTYSDGIIDDNQYALLMVKNPESINDESVMYIDQAAASGGQVTFTDFIPKELPANEQQTWTVLLGGAFNGKDSPVTVGTLTYGEGVPLSGKVELEGRTSGKYAGATVTLTDGSGASRTATTVADGSYSIAGVAPGTYTLKITMPGYLSYTINNLEVDGSAVATKTLLGGDIIVDGQVTIRDLSSMLGKYGSTTSDADDINADGQVTIRDLTILLGNYGATATAE